jgi:hypothetical protein
MVSGRMMMIRACPSLLIATVMKDPFAAGSRARHLTVFSSFLFFCRLPGKELPSHFV